MNHYWNRKLKCRLVHFLNPNQLKDTKKSTIAWYEKALGSPTPLLKGLVALL